LLSAIPLLLAGDRAIGVWKFNPEKSNYESGPPPQKSIRRFEAADGGCTFIHRGIDARGHEFYVTYTAKYDGKEYPVKGARRYDRVMQKMIDDSTVDLIFKKGDEVTVKARRVISKDGKTMTITATGKHHDGKAFKNVVVYERSEPLP
jgi:hypothetical protein